MQTTTNEFAMLRRVGPGKHVLHGVHIGTT